MDTDPYELKPWEKLFQMFRGQGEQIAKVCRDLESQGRPPTVDSVSDRTGKVVTRQQIETYMRQTGRL